MDITINRLVPAQYEVNSTPTLIFFKNGRIVNRVAGLLPRTDIERHLDYLIGS